LPQNWEELKKLTWDNLKDCQVVFLATIEGNKPRVRPVTLMRKRNDLFTVSGKKSAKIKQIMENSTVEFAFSLPDIGFNSIRVECLAEIVNDKKIKAEIYDSQEHALIRLVPTKFIVIMPPSFEAITIPLT
jgi:uncharacterized pyridoxamine 5'-phosphate oxidase family protein